jgi:hypothetical protein
MIAQASAGQNSAYATDRGRRQKPPVSPFFQLWIVELVQQGLGPDDIGCF